MNDPEKKSQHRTIGSRTIIIIGLVIGVIGIGGAFAFSKKIDGFFWEARTKAVVQLVSGVTNTFLNKDDISRWQESTSQKHLRAFAEDIKIDLSDISAIKIFTNDGTIAWTDLQNVAVGYREEGIASELQEVKDVGHLIKPAGEAVKQELRKTDLLEIWTVLKDSQGGTLGYIEIYFDSSDIKTFINQVKYSVIGGVSAVLVIVIFLTRLAFGKQDELIIRQAEELTNIVEQSPIGIYTIDMNGVIRSYNPAMMRISGITNANETIGKNVFDAETYKKNGLDILLADGLVGKSFETEAEIESSFGEHKKTFRHYRGVPIKNKALEVEGLLVMVEDITEHKKLEGEIASRTEILEKGVAERTKSLQEKIDELERFQRLTIDREIKMTELKQEIEKMRIKLESLGEGEFPA